MSVLSGALLAVLLSTEADAVQFSDGFYLGAISNGTRELDVGLELKVDGNALSGSYYYFGRSQETLTLRGTIGADGAVRLEEPGPDGRVTGVWAGNIARGVFSGTWTAPGKAGRWSFRLVRSENASKYFEGSPHSSQSGSTGPITYTMARVPASKHRIPLMTSFRDRRVISAVNATLMGTANAAHCAEPPDDHSFDSEVTFVGEDVLSVRITESWFCGTAYPTTDADGSVVFDLRTGQPISRAELFRADATAEQITEVLFAYEVAQTRVRGASRKADGQSIDDERCIPHWTAESLAGHGFTFHLSIEGLVVQPELPHVIAACANQVTVPYRALTKVAAAGGALARLAAAHARSPLRYRIHRSGTAPGKDVFHPPLAK